MSNNYPYTILLISDTLGKDSLEVQALESIGYRTTVSRFPANVPYFDYSLILCAFELTESHDNQIDMASFIKKTELSRKPLLFFIKNTKNTPLESDFPIITLQNKKFLTDYLRLKIIESEKFDTQDDFTKALLKKDLERENASRKLEGIRALFKYLPERLNDKVIFLSRRGSVINYSKGFRNLPFIQGEPQRHRLLDGLHPEDYKKIRNTLKEFAKQKRESASFWIRHQAGQSGYHYFKANLANFFDTGELDFTLLSLESGNSTKDHELSKPQNSWVSDFLESITTKDEKPKLVPIQRFLALFPKLLDIRKFFIIIKQTTEKSESEIYQWANKAHFFSEKKTLKTAQKYTSTSFFSILEQYKYEEFRLEVLNPENLSHQDMIDFCKTLELESFVTFPMGIHTHSQAYFIFDTKSAIIKEKYLNFLQPKQATDEEKVQETFSVHMAFDFLNFLPVPISIKDNKHRWMATNDAMLSFIGKDRTEVIGKTDYELFMEDEANVFWETDQLVLEEKINLQNEEYIYAADGTQRIVVTNKSLFETPDGNSLIVNTMKDVTKLKEIEKDLRERTEKLRKSERKLKSLNSTKDRFFSIIAHDLKNPFNTLIGFSSILSEDLDQFDKEEVEEFIKIIYDAAQHGYKLLENLLDWARTQTGKFQFEPTTINIQFLIDECLPLLWNLADKKKIKLHSKLSHAVYAFADANMVELVIRNLLSNAVKFTNYGGEVEIEVLELNNFIEISVIDNGIGIKKEDLDKLFRIDIEFTKTGTDAETGTGLGLILCKEFVEKNGGKIYVESSIDKGSRFAFKLPKNEQIANNSYSH